MCHFFKLLCDRLAPKAGEALGHAETPPVAVTRSQGRPQAVVNRRCAGVSLASNLLGLSSDGKAQLQILCQPEQQHRARYQTEGSRGAVKDRSGNGFPVVKVVIECSDQQTFPGRYRNYVRWGVHLMLLGCLNQERYDKWKGEKKVGMFIFGSRSSW